MKKEYRGNGVNIFLDDDMLTFDKMFKKTKVSLEQLTGVFFREAGEVIIGNVERSEQGEFIVNWKTGKMSVKVPLSGGNEPFRELYETLVAKLEENLNPEEFESFLKDTEDFNRAASANKTALDMNRDFFPTKVAGTMLEVDEKNKKWRIYKTKQIYNFDDIVDFELLEDGESLLKGGGVGKAIVGGALFGGVGAVVGGATAQRKNKAVCISMMIKITLNNMQFPVAYIKLITSATKKDSMLYRLNMKNAQEILSVLQLICNEKNVSVEQPAKDADSHNIDDLRKLKALLDDGIITQEDFDAKKKQILGL